MNRGLVASGPVNLPSSEGPLDGLIAFRRDWELWIDTIGTSQDCNQGTCDVDKRIDSPADESPSLDGKRSVPGPEERGYDVERASHQLAAIVNSSHDAIVSKDLNGRIISWNAGAERLFGFSASEAIGKFIGIIIPPDRLAEEPEILRRIRSGEIVDHFDTVRCRKDGGLVEISLTISPVRDAQGNVVGASKIAREIGERKRIEARLRQSELQLRSLLDAIPAALYTTDAEGNVTYFNQAAVDYSCVSPEIGTPWPDCKLYRPDGSQIEPENTPMEKALREARPIRNEEVVAETPAGDRVSLLPYVTPVVDGDGKVLGTINMLVDVSERKQAESQQRILFNELNHRVKNNMQTLQALLLLSASKSSNAEVHAVLQHASARVAAMAAAQKVLYTTPDATSFEAGRFLSAVVEAARASVASDIVITQDADDLLISNDVAMPLALILNELLTNAAKYGSQDGQPAGVLARLAREGEHIVLSVEDDGPGFDVEKVSTSGIQLVKGLVRQIRGHFAVSSSPTRCAVYLPSDIERMPVRSSSS